MARMARTVRLSWLQLSNICTNVSISICESVPLLIATAICHGIPRLAKRSVWLTRNLRRRYFMAQSNPINTEDSSSSFSISSLHSSWLAERRKWDFQALRYCLDWTITKFNSSLASFGQFDSSRVSSISATTKASWKHLPQRSSWSWSQSKRQPWSPGSLIAWSALNHTPTEQK